MAFAPNSASPTQTHSAGYLFCGAQQFDPVVCQQIAFRRPEAEYRRHYYFVIRKTQLPDVISPGGSDMRSFSPPP